jgi:hypothetical protein
VKTVVHRVWILVLVFGCVLLAPPLWGKNHRFQSVTGSDLCGVQLEPGEYSLRLSEDVVGIYKGNELMVVAKVRIEPIGQAPSNSCCRIHGCLTEVRLDNEWLIFLRRVETSP